MRHRHRPRRPPRRPRLRPAREIQTETASGGRITGAQQRATRPAPTATRQPASHHRGARHLRDLAAAATHPQRNRPARAAGGRPAGPAGLDRGSGTPPGHQLRPSPLQRRPRPQPRLRHLVEIRDGECDYPPCRRAAARCDFEHTIAWEDGGATCSCNAGPRCRHHHHQKQHPAGEWSSTSPATAPGPPPPAANTPPDPPPTRSDPRRRWSGRARGRRTCGPRPGPGPGTTTGTRTTAGTRTRTRTTTGTDRDHGRGPGEDQAAAGMARPGTASAAPHHHLPGVTPGGRQV